MKLRTFIVVVLTIVLYAWIGAAFIWHVTENLHVRHSAVQNSVP